MSSSVHGPGTGCENMGFGRAGLCFAQLVPLLLMRAVVGSCGHLALPCCSTCHSHGVVVACLLLSRSAAEVGKFPVTPLSAPSCTSADPRLPSGFSFVAGITTSLSVVSWGSYSVGFGGLSCAADAFKAVCVCLQVVAHGEQPGPWRRPNKTNWGEGKAGKQHFADLSLQI